MGKGDKLFKNFTESMEHRKKLRNFVNVKITNFSLKLPSLGFKIEIFRKFEIVAKTNANFRFLLIVCDF